MQFDVCAHGFRSPGTEDLKVKPNPVFDPCESCQQTDHGDYNFELRNFLGLAFLLQIQQANNAL